MISDLRAHESTQGGTGGQNLGHLLKSYSIFHDLSENIHILAFGITYGRLPVDSFKHLGPYPGQILRHLRIFI